MRLRMSGRFAAWADAGIGPYGQGQPFPRSTVLIPGRWR